MSDCISEKQLNDIQLRNVDLNLLTVFDAVMQVQNITRAAQMLGMSQPAVSNAVARLKLMFNDELFVRYGRGIQPTMRARQLFGPIRQALQLVLNELPGAGFDPQNSERLFAMAICSPLDIRLTAKIFNFVTTSAPNIQLKLTSSLNDNIDHQLRYQDVEFVISYNKFEREEFCNEVLFTDELVAVCSSTHSRLNSLSKPEPFFNEKHAAVNSSYGSTFSAAFYNSTEAKRAITYQATDLSSAINVVAQTEMVALVPRWLAEEFSATLKISLLPIKWMNNELNCYLSWHESAGKDKAHRWMKTLLLQSRDSL